MNCPPPPPPLEHELAEGKAEEGALPLSVATAVYAICNCVQRAILRSGAATQARRRGRGLWPSTRLYGEDRSSFILQTTYPRIQGQNIGSFLHLSQL